MNYAIVFRLLGYILMIEGTLLLLPAVTSLIYAEWAVMGVFLLTAAVSAALGLCWKAGTAAEVIALSSGSIGEKLYNAKIYFQTADLFAWTAAIVLKMKSTKKKLSLKALQSP